MTIIVFLVDNSASMAQKTSTGITYLDFARQIVDNFVKLRQRDQPACKTDRYMLMGFDEYPRNVKAGWKENQTQFNEQIRNLRPTGSSQFAEAFFNAVRFVNLNRVNTGIENYAYGRYPSYTEPVVFVAIVDANGDLNGKSFLQNGKFPRLPAPGSELTDEPYRWDHRLFAFLLNMSGHPAQKIETPPPPSNARKEVDIIVEKMNGSSFEISSHKTTIGIIESIIQQIQQNGVFVRFERDSSAPNLKKVTEDGDTTTMQPDDWKSQVVMITRVPRSGAPNNQPAQSSWPIPEAFWPDSTLSSLPPRKVYPELMFRCEKTSYIGTTNVALDKYEVGKCPLVQVLMENGDPSLCWQVFVKNSNKRPGEDYPFGYLKLSGSKKTVNLFVFPYNYPLLFLIIEMLRNSQNGIPAFRQNVDKYFKNLPCYYVTPLRKALVGIPIPHPLLTDTISPLPCQSSLLNQIKKWKEAGRNELDVVCQRVSNCINIHHPDGTRVFNIVCGSYQLPMVGLYRLIPSPEKSTKYGLLKNYQFRQQRPADHRIALSSTRGQKNSSTKFMNPFDIEREELVDQLEKMRVNLGLHFRSSSTPVLEGGLPGQRIKLQHAEDLHSLPVPKMGDYQEYARRLIESGMGPKRELEDRVAKPRAFGNPFKVDKDKKTMEVDEVGEMPTDTPVNGNLNPGGSTPTRKDDAAQRAELMRQWRRRASTPSRESSPMPRDNDKPQNTDEPRNNDEPQNDDEPRKKKPRLGVIIGDENSLEQAEETVVIEQSTNSAANDNVSHPVVNIQAGDANTVDKTKRDRQVKKATSKNTDTDVIVLQRSLEDVVDKGTKRLKPLDTLKAKKRNVDLPEFSSSSSGSSSSSDETDASNECKTNSIYGDSEAPTNIEFERRVYPSMALSDADDPPTLTKQEMIRLKFYLIRAIRHRDNSIKYDPGKECIRLINDLSWREQFECLEYACEEAKKFGLSMVTNFLSAELKRIAKCIRIPTLGSHQTNGSSSRIF